jgi:hypothetical protein
MCTGRTDARRPTTRRRATHSSTVPSPNATSCRSRPDHSTAANPCSKGRHANTSRRPEGLNVAATVTLCWQQKASHFWIMLLLLFPAFLIIKGSRPRDHAQFDDFIGLRVQPCRFQVKEDTALDLPVCRDRRKSIPGHQTTLDSIVARFLQRMRHLRKVVARAVGHGLTFSDRSEAVWVMGTP